MANISHTGRIDNFFWNIPSSIQNGLFTIYKKVNILITEIFAVFTVVIPNAIKWNYKVKCGDITGVNIKTTSDQTEKMAILYTHHKNNSKRDDDLPAVLFLHGDYSHPFTLLPLIETAKKHDVYSLHLPLDPLHSNTSQLLIKKALDQIKEKNIVMVGHSKGGIQSAHTAFVKENEKICGVVTIAGRVQCLDGDETCHPKLKPLINEVQNAVNKSPLVHLFQIIPEQDWNAPISAMQIRPTTSTIVKGAMHLNVLYKKETKEILEDYLLKLSTHLTHSF